jgi:RING finger protein 26
MTLLEDEVCSVKSQRMCVVCQEREKTVVLMPCRHLCLCDVCGDAASSQVKACPLCRRQIVNKINVYA